MDVHADDALGADLLGGQLDQGVEHLVEALALLGLADGLGHHDDGVHHGGGALGEEAHHVAVGHEAQGVAVLVHERGRGDAFVNKEVQGIEHGCVGRQGVHIAAHDGLQDAATLARGVGRGCLAGLVLHKDEREDEGRKAHEACDDEGHVRAVDACVYGVHAGGGVGHGGGDAHDDGGAQRARYLAERVAYRGAVVHEAVVQGVHAPGADGHVHERQREETHGVQGANPRDRRGVTQQRKAERRDGQHAGTDEAEHARTALVEEAACHKAHEGHDDGAGQEHQARGSCRDAAQGLQVDGHEDAGGHEGALHDHADDGGDEELAVGEHTHLQHGLFHLELAGEEHDEGHNAHDDADQGGCAYAGATDD